MERQLVSLNSLTWRSTRSFSDLPLPSNMTRSNQRFLHSCSIQSISKQSERKPRSNPSVSDPNPELELVDQATLAPSRTPDSSPSKGTYIYKAQKRHLPTITPEIEQTLRPHEQRWRGSPFFHILASPLRQCVATRKVLPRELLLELKVSFVRPSSISKFPKGSISPSGAVIISHGILRSEPSNLTGNGPGREGVKTPGRGIWLTLDRKILDFVGETGLYRRLYPSARFPSGLATLVRNQLERRVIQEARLMKSRIVTQPRSRFDSEVNEALFKEVSKETPQSLIEKNMKKGLVLDKSGELIQGLNLMEVKKLNMDALLGLQDRAPISAWLDFHTHGSGSSISGEISSEESSTDLTSPREVAQDFTTSTISSLPRLSLYSVWKLLSPHHVTQLKEIIFSCQRKSKGLDEETKSKALKEENLFYVVQDELTVGLVVALYRLRIWRRSEEDL